ncbi:MAG: hypothetical protein F6K21_29030 [Symploca sp. SIO2D2]|nr:hypothetical protein [Symploca sp. SIO2D2]
MMYEKKGGRGNGPKPRIKGYSNDVLRQMGVGRKRLVLKIVLPGSGDNDWRTREGEHIDPISATYKPARLEPYSPGRWTEQRRNKKRRAVEKVNERGRGSGPKRYSIKKEGKKKELNVSGPGAEGTEGAGIVNEKIIPGLADMGSNSIVENKLFVREWVKQEIMKEHAAVNDSRAGRMNEKLFVLILIKAHSRNSVGATNLANEIIDDIDKNYVNRYNSLINSRVELVAFDPVPGYNQSEAWKHEVRLNERIVSTVVYSIVSGYKGGFTPQLVKGAKRIIITDNPHHAGIVEGFSPEVGASKLYGSQLNSLEPGVYFDNTRMRKQSMLRGTSEEGRKLESLTRDHGGRGGWGELGALEEVREEGEAVNRVHMMCEKWKPEGEQRKEKSWLVWKERKKVILEALGDYYMAERARESEWNKWNFYK